MRSYNELRKQASVRSGAGESQPENFLSSVKLRKTGIELKTEESSTTDGDATTPQQESATTTSATPDSAESAPAQGEAAAASTPTTTFTSSNPALRMNKPAATPPRYYGQPQDDGSKKDVAALIRNRIKTVRQTQNYRSPNSYEWDDNEGGNDSSSSHDISSLKQTLKKTSGGEAIRAENMERERILAELERENRTIATMEESMSNYNNRNNSPPSQIQLDRDDGHASVISASTGVISEKQPSLSSPSPPHHSQSQSQSQQLVITHDEDALAAAASGRQEEKKGMLLWFWKNESAVEKSMACCAIVALLLFCVLGAVFLTLYFTGVLDFDGEDGNNKDSNNGGDADKDLADGEMMANGTTWPPTMGPNPFAEETPFPTAAPTTTPRPSSSAVPSAAPSVSAAPITTCEASLITSEYNTIEFRSSSSAARQDLRNDDDNDNNNNNETAVKEYYAPNIAMDGNSAVVVTNDGGVHFYSLSDDDDDGDDDETSNSANRAYSEWTRVNYFPNINRSPTTPSVAISGNVAVVGFLYRILGLDQGVGGAYVYERDERSGKWTKVDELTPNNDGGSSGSSSSSGGEQETAAVDLEDKFGWSVDVTGGSTHEPVIVVGAPGTNNNAGAVYAFAKHRRSRRWSRIGDRLTSEVCPVRSASDRFRFGYSVAVHDDVIAATADCEFVVQLSKYDRDAKEISSLQNIPYISFDWGASGSLVMDARHLVYSTAFGRVAIYERRQQQQQPQIQQQQRRREFEFAEQLDFSGNRNLIKYPLSIDRDVLAVGVGNEYWIFPKIEGSYWRDYGAFSVENQRASNAYAPSVALSGRNVMAGSAYPAEEVYHYNVETCTHPMPTQSPTSSAVPTPETPAPTLSPSSKPSASVAPTPFTRSPTSSPTISFQPSPLYDACLTREQCYRKSLEMDATFYSGSYSTKGCFWRNDNVFFSMGTLEEMSKAELSSGRVRIWCDKKTPMPTTPSPTEFVSEPPNIPINAAVPCLTEEDCYEQSIEMGASFYLGNYITKGCFWRNDNVFFSPGTLDEMSTPIFSTDRVRVSCNATQTAKTPSPAAVSEETGEAAAPNDDSPITNSTTIGGRTACLTRKECAQKSRELGLSSFNTGDYPTKGCFRKKGNAFFSLGTVEEMRKGELSGVQERIWC